MSTIEGGDGKDVHEGKDDAQEGRHQPEHVPVPDGREQTTDGSKATQRLGTVGGEQILQVAHIATQHVPAVGDACGEALEESVLNLRRLVVAQYTRHAYTELQLRSEDDGGGVGGNGCSDTIVAGGQSLFVCKHHRCRAQAQAVGRGLGLRHLVGQTTCLLRELVP